ncbi:MAG: hypothetical protein UY89_C0012G0005 [Parcubacteria group bacterium GW2011_GWA1_54_9]|nr:MAG: hypothetical protein UY89_C0012G0005 [Parcubacteria group bacterium GW2011_GWA1_54_9]
MECENYLVNAAREYLGQVVPGLLQPMVGHAVLEVVIGANFFRTVAGTYLGFASRGVLLRLLFFVQLFQLRRENLQGLLAVGELTAL